jgi:hypothetical protein
MTVADLNTTTPEQKAIVERILQTIEFFKDARRWAPDETLASEARNIGYALEQLEKPQKQQKQ